MRRLIEKLLDDPYYPQNTLKELQMELECKSPEQILKQSLDKIKEFCMRYEILDKYVHIVIKFKKGTSIVIAPCVLSENNSEWDNLNTLLLIVDLKNKLLNLKSSGEI